VLALDPCSLLDPVLATQNARFAELAKDHDGQGGKTTDSSRCEARLALTLETHGILMRDRRCSVFKPVLRAAGVAERREAGAAGAAELRMLRNFGAAAIGGPGFLL
jgi:hypothetical protein